VQFNKSIYFGYAKKAARKPILFSYQAIDYTGLLKSIMILFYIIFYIYKILLFIPFCVLLIFLCSKRNIYNFLSIL